MTGRVQDKIALVTGGSSGIGRGAAERLATEGAIVFITDLQEEMGEGVAGGIRAAGGRCEFIRHDVTDEDSWIAAVARVEERHGRLDVLFNNAGISVVGNVFAMSLQDWRRQRAVNLDGVFLGVKHGIPLMRASGDGGTVINTSSLAGLRASADAHAYCATKGGVRLFTKAIALRCAADKDRIRVNSLHPGFIDTPMGASSTVAGRKAGDLTMAAVPLGYRGVPLDIANMVLWLASDESRYVTGAELVVDGGYMAR